MLLFVSEAMPKFLNPSISDKIIYGDGEITQETKSMIFIKGRIFNKKNPFQYFPLAQYKMVNILIRLPGHYFLNIQKKYPQRFLWLEPLNHLKFFLTN